MRIDFAPDRLTLATALDTLPTREKTVLTMRFFKEMSQRQVAERIDMSQMHGSRLERGALRKLREVLQRSRESEFSEDERVVAGTGLSAA